MDYITKAGTLFDYALTYDKAKALIEAGADIHEKRYFGCAVLGFVLGGIYEHYDERYDLIELLLKCGADTKYSLFYDVSVEVYELLIANGADIRVKNKEGHTPLHFAVGSGCHELVKVLLKHGVDVNIRDRVKRTPLHYVHDVDMAKLLIAHGADVTVKDKRGMTPLHRVNRIKLAKVLLDAGADVNAKDKEGNTPFTYKGEDSI